MNLKKTYEIYELLNDRLLDEYNAPIKEYKFRGKLDLIVVAKKQEVMAKDLLVTKIGYLGLTVDKTLKKGSKVISLDGQETFLIDYVNNATRLSQITLTEVK